MKFRHLLTAAALLSAGAAQADILKWSADFVPEGAGGRSGSGSTVVTFDTVTHVLSYVGSFAGLSSNATQSHFHCCTAVPGTGTSGIAVDSPSLVGFPTGVKSGSFDAFVNLDDPDSFNATFLANNGGTTAGATAAFLAGIAAGKVYQNIHTVNFPGGEIRGFLAPVPEPSTYALMLLGLAAVGASARRRR